jgi:hypothetical protein
MRKCEYNNSALKFKIDGMSALFGIVQISNFSTLKFLMKWLEKCFCQRESELLTSMYLSGLREILHFL